MQFFVSTKKKMELVDITDQVEGFVERSGIKTGACLVYAPHATAAVIINEFEPNLQSDFERVFSKLLPEGSCMHDKIDDNASAHLLSGILGSGKTIPVEDGKLALGTWQRIMLCEFDGPRAKRDVTVTVMKA